MTTYFGFSDECGDYRPNMSAKQLGTHPFYIRSTLLINSNEWKTLSQKFRDLKVKYGLPLSKELKWSYLWNLRHHINNKKVIPSNHEIKFLEKYDYKTLIDFVEEALLLINYLQEKKIIITYTKNDIVPAINEKSMLSMHIQEHMQRIEMELQGNNENLAVLFFDPVNNEKNEYFRQLYYELFENGDYVKYQHIKDSLNIENSHHSVGIQLADYISGTFSSIVKSGGKVDYSRGVKMFYDSVFQNLRSNWSGKIQGYGIREVPSNGNLRAWNKKQIEDLRLAIGKK